jgi:hypothetical protein
MEFGIEQAGLGEVLAVERPVRAQACQRGEHLPGEEDF